MKTQNRYVAFLIRSALAILAGLGLALLLNIQAVAGEVKIEVLQTKTDTFKNVTVTGRNGTDIYLTHSRGMSNVKIKDLDAETLWRLGLGPEPVRPATSKLAVPAGAAPAGTIEAGPAVEVEATGLSEEEAAALAQLPPELQAQMQAAMALQEGLPDIAISSINPIFIGVALAIVLFIHLFYSYCLKLIVEKTGEEAGFLVWLPVLQMFPMLRGAGMSGWWFLAFFVPVLNLVAAILWCVKIVQARGKSVWVTICLLLPGLNFFAFLYLAFSNGEAVGKDAPLSANSPPVLLEA